MAELEFWEQHYELDIRTQRHVVCVVTYSCGPEINFQTVLLPGTGLIIPEGNYPICGYIPDLRPTLLSHPEKVTYYAFLAPNGCIVHIDTRVRTTKSEKNGDTIIAANQQLGTDPLNKVNVQITLHLCDATKAHYLYPHLLERQQKSTIH